MSDILFAIAYLAALSAPFVLGAYLTRRYGLSGWWTLLAFLGPLGLIIVWMEGRRRRGTTQADR